MVSTRAAAKRPALGSRVGELCRGRERGGWAGDFDRLSSGRDAEREVGPIDAPSRVEAAFAEPICANSCRRLASGGCSTRRRATVVSHTGATSPRRGSLPVPVTQRLNLARARFNPPPLFSFFSGSEPSNAADCRVRRSRRLLLPPMRRRQMPTEMNRPSKATITTRAFERASLGFRRSRRFC